MSKASFNDAGDIQKELESQNQEALTRALTNLRNQFSFKPTETISPTDKRLSLAQQWLEQSPGAQKIFEIWSAATSGQTLLISLLVSVLSAVLNLLSTHYTFHAKGYPIIKTLLSAQWSRKLNSYLTGSSNDLIIATLKLFNSISMFAHGRERKRLLETFSWETKALPKLLKMRRRGKGGEQVDPLLKPDIRTLYILFLLSFVGPDTVPQVKAEFLEQQKMKFLGIFKGLSDDSLPVIRRVLEICWAGIWSDVKLKRTIKLSLFNEVTIDQMAKLYERTEPEDEEIPADIVHHFLLAICTHPGSGICFKDQGWYPRHVDRDPVDNEEEGDKAKRGTLHNKILANVLKSLKANEDLRQQELTMKILTACPELVAGYWQGAGLTLEPRLSSKWLFNIALFGSIVSLPVPAWSFFVPEASSELYNPAPPPLSTILENVLPSISFRNLAKGLSPSTAGLVQHCSAIALSKCLVKYHQVLTILRRISEKLEEDDEDGQWSKRRRDLEREMRKRVPAFEVIITFAQHRDGLDSSKEALISESANRLLWLYHECLPELVLQTTLDIGKLVVKSFERVHDEEKDYATSNASERLHVVEQLHVYRLLRSSEYFAWNNKPASSRNTYMGLLLKAYARSRTRSTRATVGSLLEHLLANSILFEEDQDEPSLWLRSLPTTRRSLQAESPDGAPLTDESDGVINFLDDCIQRCLKTTHRYIDEMYSVLRQGSSDDTRDYHQSSLSSPLLMTVFEQFTIAMTKKLLSPSDSLAVATFLRTLVVNLSTGVEDLRLLRTLASRLSSAMMQNILFDKHPLITAAIRRELKTLGAIDTPPAPDQDHMMELDSSPEIKGFVDEVEKLAHSISPTLAAYELVDWVRLINQPISFTEIQRVVNLVLGLYAPATFSFCLALPPDPERIWTGLNITQRPDIVSHLDAYWLFLNTTDSQLADDAIRSVLVDCIFLYTTTVVSLKRFLRPLARRLAKASQSGIQSILALLVAILNRSGTVLNAEDRGNLKDFIFIQSIPMRQLCMSNTLETQTEEVLVSLIEINFDPGDAQDKVIVQEFTAYWAHQLAQSLQTTATVQGLLVTCWIKYMPSKDLLQLLELFDHRLTEKSDEWILNLVEPVASSLCRTAAIEPQLVGHLSRLLRLQRQLPDCEALQDIVASALDSFTPTGLFTQLGGSEYSLQNILWQAEARWSNRLELLPSDVLLDQFMDQDIWFESTVRIICHILGSTPASSAKFAFWLQSQSKRAIHLLIPIFLTHLKIVEARQAVISPEEAAAFSQYVSALLRVMGDSQQSDHLRMDAALCMTLLFSSTPNKEELTSSFIRHIEKLPAISFNSYILVSVLKCHKILPEPSQSLVDALAQYGLQWIPNNLDDRNDRERTRVIVSQLTQIIELASSLKPHVVESFALSVIQHHLGEPEVTDLLNQALQRAHLKPVLVNRCLQGIIQHPQFYKVCAFSRQESRNACLNALFTIFHLHPVNTCQITHVQPLLRLYGGTLSKTDGQLLRIFDLFEQHRKMSIGGLLGQWHATPSMVSSNSLEALQSLNPSLVFRSTVKFPNWCGVHENALNTPKPEQDNYDPLFLMLLFAQTLEECPPQKPSEWVELFRTNMLGLLVRALSARDPETRELGLGQLSRLWEMLQKADIQEKPHVLHILSLLKDNIPRPSQEGLVVRLPTYTTLLLAHSLRAIFYPSHFIYPITARFLLQRPKLDLYDVPLLFSLLYSTSDDWKKERAWIMRFLVDGLVSETDWRVLKRRHTWDLLASLFQSSTDKPLRKSILELLANLTCIRQATTSLILKSGFLSWIEMQLQNYECTDEETVPWLKILENVLVIVDQEKLETATYGHWRHLIGRCLLLLFTKSRPDSSRCAILQLASQVTLRLSRLSKRSESDCNTVVEEMLKHLRRCEERSDVKFCRAVDLVPNPLSLPPYSSSILHELPEPDNWLSGWGACVELLWQAAMYLEVKTAAWDSLTSRLLIWSTLVQNQHSPLSGWVTQQAIISRVDTEQAMNID